MTYDPPPHTMMIIIHRTLHNMLLLNTCRWTCKFFPGLCSINKLPGKLFVTSTEKLSSELIHQQAKFAVKQLPMYSSRCRLFLPDEKFPGARAGAEGNSVPSGIRNSCCCLSIYQMMIERCRGELEGMSCSRTGEWTFNGQRSAGILISGYK